MHQHDAITKACIDTCTTCYQTCLHTAMSTCLEAGGKHVEAKHFRLIMSCADICQATTHAILSHSAHAKHLCKVCADICDACAVDCEKVGDMKDCVTACRNCAAACRKMAA